MLHNMLYIRHIWGPLIDLPITALLPAEGRLLAPTETEPGPLRSDGTKHSAISFPSGRCNDLVCARHIGKAAILWTKIYAVRSSRASKGEMLQKWHHKEKNLHTGKRLSNTWSLSWQINKAIRMRKLSWIKWRIGPQTRFVIGLKNISWCND